MRQPVGLEGIDFLLRPDEVLERITATAVARDNMIQVAAIPADEFAGVLADALVALENRSSRNAWNADRHAIVVRGHDHGGHTKVELRRRHGEIEVTHRQLGPLVPRERIEIK